MYTLIRQWILDVSSQKQTLKILVREENIGVPGEKPSKHRRDQLWELNSHEIPHQTWFQWWEAQRANRLRQACLLLLC